MASQDAEAPEARQREALRLLAEEVDDPDCADFVLICADGQVRVSRRRLARQPYSDYFRRLVAPGFKEAVDDQVVLSGAPATSHVRTLCRFLYCGIAELDKDCVLEVLRLADVYLMPDLASDCRAWITDNMSAELAEATLRIGQSVYDEKHGPGSFERNLLLRFPRSTATKISENERLPRGWLKRQVAWIQQHVNPRFDFNRLYASHKTKAALTSITHSDLRAMGIALFGQRDRIITRFREAKYPVFSEPPLPVDMELDLDEFSSASESENERENYEDANDSESGSESEAESDGDGANDAAHEGVQVQRDADTPGALEAPANDDAGGGDGGDGGDGAAKNDESQDETKPIDSQAATLKPLVHAARSFCRSNPDCVCDHLEKRLAEGECIFGPLLLDSLFAFDVHEPESDSETHPFLQDLEELDDAPGGIVTAALTSRILRLTIRFMEENPRIGKKERSAVLAIVPFWKIPPQDLQYLVLRHTTLRDCRSVRRIIRKLLYKSKWRKKLVDFVFFDARTVKRARSPLQDRLDAAEHSLREAKRERRIALEQVKGLKGTLETMRERVNVVVTAAMESLATT